MWMVIDIRSFDQPKIYIYCGCIVFQDVPHIEDEFTKSFDQRPFTVK